MFSADDNLNTMMSNRANKVMNLKGDIKNQKLLELFKSTVIRNESNINSKQNRYDQHLKEFSTYLYLIGGNLLYQTLYSNMNGAMPSITTVRRQIERTSKTFNEGEFRFRELKQFLVSRNLPLCVWISEDATKIIERIDYSPRNNKNVGFVLPIKEDGLINTAFFKATSYQEIKRQFSEETVSTYAYVIMAQPLQNNCPSFCLSVFGTDNKFSSEHVRKRWHTMKEYAQKKYGIHILGFSSDGDPRLLKCMRLEATFPQSSHLEQQNASWNWFQANLETENIPVQDTVHIGTKFRNRLLKPSIYLPVGNKIISSSHLAILISNISKDVHFLTGYDINPDDKMNFQSVERIISEKVTTALLDHVPNSEATAFYLKIIRDMLNCFLMKNMSIQMRLYLAWKVVFQLRIWRNWILTTNEFTLKDNFITLNNYISVEINAHSLILLIRKFSKFQERFPASMFVPWLMSSQPCEQLFRSTRSMTSTFSTIVNFSLLEIMNRINKIQFLQNAVNNLKGTFCFPREDSARLGSEGEIHQEIPFVILSDEEIESIVLSSLQDAKLAMNALGISDIPDNFFLNLNLRSYDNEATEHEYEDEMLSNRSDVNLSSEFDDIVSLVEDDSSNEDISGLVSGTLSHPESILLNDIENIEDHLQIKDYSKDTNKSTNIFFNDGPFLRVSYNDEIMVVRKSTLCWLFTKNRSKLSSDRTIRVRSEKKLDPTGSVMSRPMKSNIISIGDWCIFENNFKYKKTDFIIGCVLSFKYLSKKGKQTEYAKHFVNISELNVKSSIGCLANWYDIEEDGGLSNSTMNKYGFCDISNYKISVPEPNRDCDKLVIKMDILDHLKTASFRDSDSDSNSNSIRLTDSDSEELNEFEDDNSLDVALDETEKIRLEISAEKYYGVFYDQRWYIGRVLKCNENDMFTLKFLKEDLSNFYWPKPDDVDCVQKEQIFYGPINMLGCDPLQITRYDRNRIVKIFKNLKKKGVQV
ncbi:unnamed protein product [Phaedon cochleariae]|uniref:Uncharacterized protein n=1 Tax=Phaedon cochleariae TaxID=80249 RepID=A0A9N9X0R4_PHACE|nr:unnamed protein product [Phaedon cochleariae]